MELSCTLRFSCVLVVILVKEFDCQSDNSEGKCWDEYLAEIVENGDQGNVLYVCTDSPLSNVTDTVYMDMRKVTRTENSTCYCTVTFTNENDGDVNSVRLDYKIESSTDALTVNDNGDDRFSRIDTVHDVVTGLKINNITFTLTSPESDFKSCLRITSIKEGQSLFLVKCFTNQLTPEADISFPTNTWMTPRFTTPVAYTSSPTKASATPTSTTPVGDTSSPTKTWTTPTSTAPVGDTSSSTNTWTTPTSPSSGESTIETGHGAIIGAAVGGGAVLVIIIVILIIVLLIKRKKTKNTKTKNEDYYMTENDLYNVRNSSIKSANEKTYDTYDEIEAANTTRESRIYAEVDKNKNKPNAKTKQPHTVNENEYDHLNYLKGPASTGNIYSAIGKRGSEPDSNIYNSTYQGTLGNASSGSKDDQIYDTSDEL